MNNDWQDFLHKQGAVLDTDDKVSFPEPTTEFDVAQNYLCDLSNVGLVRARGEDAQSFLHGQFTNDLNLVDEENSQLSAYCNPKGRMLAIFRIFKRDGDFYLLLRKDVVEAVLKKLNMFKLMAKVELTDLSNDLVVFGLVGPATDSLLKDNSTQLPSKPEQSITAQDTTVIMLVSENTRMLLISTPKQATNTWNNISDKCIPSNHETWDLIDIQHGIPHVSAETSEAFIPQMVNLELIGGVNFQKGCYPGQEIVARTHYLGKPNRRMYRITIESETCPSSGDNIYSKVDGEQPVGKIVSAQKINSDTYQALAVLRIEKEHDDQLHLGVTSNTKIIMNDLPYSTNANQNSTTN